MDGRKGKASALAASLALMAQWVLLHAGGLHDPVYVALSSGAAIFGAAFSLSWAAEAAQHDVPPSVAVVLVALLAVLPEYAVDMYFAWEAGKDPIYTHYATANITGANRILIGLGWPVVAFVAWRKSGSRHVRVAKGDSVEVFYLLAATLYSFVIPLKGTLSWIDAVFLVGLFVSYIVSASREAVVEPSLDGTAEMIGSLPQFRRRLAVAALFAAAGGAIFLAAEPFAESLLEIGKTFGVEEFLLVQWVAPLASETPEFVVAVIFALKLKAELGFAALLSSKVNQWTLLVGMLPLVFMMSAGSMAPMMLDERQAHEILLTSAQSLFAVILIADLRFGIGEALALLVLFLIQLSFPDPHIRMAFVFIYLGLFVAVFVFNRDARQNLMHIATRGRL